MHAMFDWYRRRAQKAQVIVLTALLMPLFIAAVGLVTDFGTMYIVHQKLENALDAAAIELGYTNQDKILNAGKENKPTISQVEKDIAALLPNTVKPNFTLLMEDPNAVLGEENGTKYLQISATTPVEPIFLRYFDVDTVDVGAKARVLVPGVVKKDDGEGEKKEDKLDLTGIIYSDDVYNYKENKHNNQDPVSNKLREGATRRNDLEEIYSRFRQMVDVNHGYKFTSSDNSVHINNSNKSKDVYLFEPPRIWNININASYTQNRSIDQPIYVVWDNYNPTDDNKDNPGSTIGIKLTGTMNPQLPVIILYNGRGTIDITLTNSNKFYGIIWTVHFTSNKGKYHGYLIAKELNLTSNDNILQRIVADMKTDFMHKEYVDKAGITTSSGPIRLVSPL